VRFPFVALVLVAACSRSPATADRAPPPARVVDAAGDASADAVPAVDPPGYYMGRKMAEPMSWHGADWLDRANRDEVQRPLHVLDVLGVREGQSVADVGCGSGYFTVHLAKRVGPRGRVYATDLQQEMLDLLTKKVNAEKLTNVTPVRTTPEDAKLPPRALDLILLVDVYHELPNPPATLAQFKAALAPKGTLALVEYRAEDPKVAIKPEHKTTLEQLKRELTANHWRFVGSDESLPEQRIVTFQPD